MRRIHIATLSGLCFLVLFALSSHFSGYRSHGTDQPEVKASERMAAIDSRQEASPGAAALTQITGIKSLRERREIGQIMQDIAQIRSHTDGNHVYDWFLELQQHLNEDADSARVVGEQLAVLNSSSASSRRQLSLLYGSLAQSQSPEALQTLLEAIAADQDEYHMIQAIAAVGDHPSPTSEATEVLWQQSLSHPEVLVRHTALLALGSIAHRNAEQADSIQGQLINLSRTPLDQEQRGVLISAMGNHGDGEYWTYLQAQGQDPEESIRASAIYASRFILLPEVNDWIYRLAVHDTSLYVKNEALKVLGIRSEDFDLLQAVTEIALSFADRELHFHASYLLISLGLDYAESAKLGIARMQMESPFSEVRDFLAKNQIN